MSAKTQQISFHFVTGNPQNESERRNVRTIVRSNASHRRWRLVRETAAKSKAQPQPDGSSENENVNDGSVSPSLRTDSTLRNRNAKSANKQRQIKRQWQASEVCRRQSDASTHSSMSGTLDGAALPTPSPQKVTNLSQNYFGIMPSSEVSRESIGRMLHGTAISYSNLFPAGKNAKFGQMAKDWFQQCLKTRGILHTALYCQAKRAQAIRPGMTVLPTNELVLCQTEALHAINDKLTQSATACDDESLRIVFSLTWHGAIKQNMPQFVPRQAPMGNLQSLRLFMGVISCDPVHAQGLDNMIALRGGLDNLEMPGLAFLISYGDVLLASLNLSRPKWSYGSYAQHNPDARAVDWIERTTRLDHPLMSLGTGFCAIRSWLPTDQAITLEQVFLDLAKYTRASDDFLSNHEQAYGPAVMADQRNAVQHALMSLALSNEACFNQRDLYELSWLAGVAYSLIATFPLAPNAAPFSRIAQLIRLKMSSSTLLSSWSEAPHLMLWITVLGAICAIGSPDRATYVEVLKQETWRLDVHSWKDLRAQLMNFLWFPIASDTDGIKLWKDIETSGRISIWKEYNGIQR
ncbi:hypothetical protein H2198_000567 [Neophaeococcomyces mojaviensis]|uniref:Uncharacterized protein n=1 Tax=Neophaeococcomyces mojaviensis TaxID=3383035 RepID=A0ACC3AJ92_9EURO|nr:hypothetical protein H2198_000567 [Knufia sp. JES_112]